MFYKVPNRPAYLNAAGKRHASAMAHKCTMVGNACLAVAVAFVMLGALALALVAYGATAPSAALFNGCAAAIAIAALLTVCAMFYHCAAYVYGRRTNR